jgi:hypothetical protein
MSGATAAGPGQAPCLPALAPRAAGARKLPDPDLVERMIMGLITPATACYSLPSWADRNSLQAMIGELWPSLAMPIAAPVVMVPVPEIVLRLAHRSGDGG